MTRINNLLAGVGSVSLIGEVPSLPAITGIDAPNIVQTIIQLIVAVATLLSLFRKKSQIIT